jgi:hypothetical protein
MDYETGLPEALGQMIYEQGKVIIDGAIAGAMAGERAAILDGLRPATVLLRAADGQEVAAVPWSVILAVLSARESTDGPPA